MLLESSQGYWMYRIINSQRPLEEKMALFWHGLFATAYGKLNHAKAVVNQTHTFRRHGLGKFADILVELSRDPAMIFWLDNKDNHRDAPNENYGRELLELFSMGIGNYTEADVKAAARAFTGWTIDNTEYMSIRASRDSFWPYGRIDWQFRYREDDHDDTDKTFLGHTGPLSGQDVIDIIVEQPATAHYIAGKLYNFFVSDRPDEESIGIMADEFTRTGGDIRAVMRCMFLSDFFADDAVRLGRVKSPAELVGGTARLAGSHRQPEWTIVNLAMDVNFMGQEILNPPTVEGWHTGMEWIDTGNLVERINARRRRNAGHRPPRASAPSSTASGRGATGWSPVSLPKPASTPWACSRCPTAPWTAWSPWPPRGARFASTRADSIGCAEERGRGDAATQSWHPGSINWHDHHHDRNIHLQPHRGLSRLSRPRLHPPC